MTYKIQTIKSSSNWDNFIQNQKNANFLQSWQWGEFKKTENKKIYRLGLFENDKQVGAWQLEKMSIKFSKKYYLYGAYTPIFLDNLKLNEKKAVLKYFTENLQKFVSQKNLAFIILESNLQENSANQKVFANWQKSTEELQPSDTLIIPINKEQNELLKNMHKKTRYNIRLSKRKGVQTIWDKKGKYFEEWFKIMQSTAQRHKIRLLPKKHYKDLIKSQTLNLIVAKFNNEIIAGNLVSLYPPTAVYVHGASLSKYRNVMGTYLLQWESILKAKEHNCKNFDFWGINVDNKHPNWQGITRFKKGFNPEVTPTSYIGTYCYKFKNLYYYLYKFNNYLRKIKKFVLTR